MPGCEISIAGLAPIYCKSHPSKQQIARTDSTMSPDGFLSLT